MRRPSGGLPGVDPEEAYLLIRVPVYGLCDSGRGFWKKVNHDALDVGLKASRIFPAFYYHESNGRVDLGLTTHVDDFLWACTDSGQVVMDPSAWYGAGKSPPEYLEDGVAKAGVRSPQSWCANRLLPQHADRQQSCLE